MSAPPREGVPPCITMSVLGERLAFLFDGHQCRHPEDEGSPRFAAWHGLFLGWAESTDHPGLRTAWHGYEMGYIETDDEDVAKGVYANADRWVRTEESP